MRLFSREIVSKLNGLSLGEPIHYVGLGARDFQFAYGDLNVRCENKAAFKIGEARYVWASDPIEAPIWTLIGQKVVGVEASLDNVLKFALSTGDEIEAWTDVGPYEAVVMEAQNHGFLGVF